MLVDGKLQPFLHGIHAVEADTEAVADTDRALAAFRILAGVLLGSSEKFMKRLGIFKKGVIINVLALTMYYGMEIWLIPVTTVLNVNNPFSAEMLIRMLGFATGLFIFPILNTIGDKERMFHLALYSKHELKERIERIVNKKILIKVYPQLEIDKNYSDSENIECLKLLGK